jgi:hypothetical protein
MFGSGRDSQSIRLRTFECVSGNMLRWLEIAQAPSLQNAKPAQLWNLLIQPAPFSSEAASSKYFQHVLFCSNFSSLPCFTLILFQHTVQRKAGLDGALSNTSPKLRTVFRHIDTSRHPGAKFQAPYMSICAGTFTSNFPKILFSFR